MTWGHEEREDLRARYAGIGVGHRDALLANRIVVGPLPKIGELRWGVSTVFRPALDALKTVMGNDHAVYNRESVHVTMRSNEGFRTPVTDADVAGYRDTMAAVVEGNARSMSISGS